jgi:hypothetical protein
MADPHLEKSKQGQFSPALIWVKKPASGHVKPILPVRDADFVQDQRSLRSLRENK